MKSSIMVINTTSGSNIAVDSVYPITQIARRTGQGIDGNNEGIVITEPGWYALDADITVTATAAGTLTAGLYANGVQIPGAIASQTVAENDVVTLPIKSIVRVTCCGDPIAINARMSGVAVTAYNAVLTAERV